MHGYRLLHRITSQEARDAGRQPHRPLVALGPVIQGGGQYPQHTADNGQTRLYLELQQTKLCDVCQWMRYEKLYMHRVIIYFSSIFK